MDLLNGLNDRQKEAVITTDGPVMVMAGAGSGKTRVLTHRIAYLINELGVSPTNILAVTFTNKAALEMKERVSKLVSVNTKSMWISTFHSFCSRFLRREITCLGYRNDFTIVDTDDSLKIMKEVCKNNRTNLDPKEVISLVSQEKNGMSVSFSNSYDKREYDIIYSAYETYLKNNNLLDFDDLIVKTLLILNSNVDILNRYSSTFNYIMIDEFQDTNTIQYNLVKLLSIIHENIFIVGDQDQSIYSFRGAKVENINKFKVDYKNTKVILLEQNYRSTQNILELANSVISHNKNRIKKNLFSDKESSQKPIYYRADSSYGEVVYVVKEIRKLVTSGYSYGDIAVIYRLNSLSRGFEEEFIRNKIPHVIYGGTPFYGRKEIKDIIAYLRLICNTSDDFSFNRIVNVPKRKIGTATLDLLKQTQNSTNCSLYDAVDNTRLTKSVTDTFRVFKNVINKLADDLENISLVEFITNVIKSTGYEDMLIVAEEDDRLDNIYELKSIMKDIDEHYEGSNFDKLKSFLNDLALKTDTDDITESEEKVKLMSYHQAKGLEYKVVFMVAMERDIFPSSRSITSEELAEEYRICYVGITRAMQKLYFTNAESRRLYGRDDYMGISEFITKMDKSKLDIVGVTRSIKETRIKEKAVSYDFNKQSDNPYSISDKIDHQVFGQGMVVGIEGPHITVAFKSPYGIKKLLSTHPSITKVVGEIIKNEEILYCDGDHVEHRVYGLGIVVSCTGDVLNVNFEEHGLKRISASHPAVKKIEDKPIYF